MKRKFTAEEERIIAETVAEGLRIQHKFRPEPLYKHTGKGYMKSDGVEEIRRIKEEEKKKANRAADGSYR
jgi:hypothetical protein